MFDAISSNELLTTTISREIMICGTKSVKVTFYRFQVTLVKLSFHYTLLLERHIIYNSSHFHLCVRTCKYIISYYNTMYRLN